jgi:hypothetical protein
LVKDVQKLQPLLLQQQQQQQQQQQIKRPASASSVNIAQSSATAPLHPHLLRSDSLPTQPEALSRAVPLPKPLALLSAAATAAEIETPWTAADFEFAKADIMSLTQASLWWQLHMRALPCGCCSLRLLSLLLILQRQPQPPDTRPSQRFAPAEVDAAASLLRRLNYSSDTSASLLAQSRCIQQQRLSLLPLTLSFLSLCRMLHLQQSAIHRSLLAEVDAAAGACAVEGGGGGGWGGQNHSAFKVAHLRGALRLNNTAAALGSAAKMTSGELAAALTGGCKNLAGKLKGVEAERAALLQSVDMHRSENRRLLEVRCPPPPPGT